MKTRCWVQKGLGESEKFGLILIDLFQSLEKHSKYGNEVILKPCPILVSHPSPQRVFCFTYIMEFPSCLKNGEFNYYKN